LGKARRARVVLTATAMTAVPIGGMIGVVAAKEEAEASVARAKSRRAELTQAIGLQRIVLLVVMTAVVALAALERGVEAVTEGDSVIEMVVTDDHPETETATEMRARPEETTTGALVRDRTSTTATVIAIVVVTVVVTVVTVVTVVVTVIEMTVVLAVAASETELKMMTPAAGVTVSPVGTTVIGGMMVLQWKERGSS
jgi:hypothetical protein